MKSNSKVSVLGVADEGFWKQLKERTTKISKDKLRTDSDLIFLLVGSKEDLKQLGSLQWFIKRSGMIWVIAPKGKQRIKQGDIMTASRKSGLVDMKVVSFSETHTALKLVILLARR